MEAVKHPRRAVIADDDEFFRLALAAILSKRLGFTDVIETGSLDEAIARLSDFADDGAVSLALFDLDMPGMTGAASLGAVRECFPTVKTAIVSSSTRRRDILLALEAGAHGYVPKGSSAFELAKALDLILSGIIFVPQCLADINLAQDKSVQALEDTTAVLHLQTSMGGRQSNASGVSVLESLTPRQRDVLQMIVNGRSNKEIARAMDLREGTIKVHVAALLRTLGVTNRAGAAAVGSRLSA